MKVIQVPFGFYPDPPGGTEIYVESLARCLAWRGIRSIIVVPGKKQEISEHEGLRIRRFSLSEGSTDLRELYGEGNLQAAKMFGRILEEEKPDLVHLHAFTRAVSVRTLRQAKAKGLPVVFTYHTPSVSCPRGNLLRWGNEPCDGLLAESRCTRCVLHGLRIPRVVAEGLGRIPAQMGGCLGQMGLSGGIWTALRMRELVTLRHQAVRQLLAESDHLIAVCAWVQDLLIRNGVPAARITLSRQGLPVFGGERIPLFGSPTSASPVSKATEPLQVAFLGRLDPTKGLHVLIRALRGSRDLPMILNVFGVIQESSQAEYQTRIQSEATGDRRIRFHPRMPSAKIVELLRAHDLIVIPSQWLETGPLVALEAFAAGVPVLGSRLGGIAELVQDGLNGFLVDRFSSPSAWAERLRRLSQDRVTIEVLRRGLRPPRTMLAVAEEMERLYRKLVGKNSLAERGRAGY